MRPTNSLDLLGRATTRQISRLRNGIARAAVARGVDRDRHVAYSTIEAANLWAEFTRAYYLSWLLNPSRSSRPKVEVLGGCTKNHGCPGGDAATWSRDQALAHAINRYRTGRFVRTMPGPTWGPRDEPAWFKTSILLDLATDLACSHLADVKAAVSIPTRVFADLPVVRNFFAHRNDRTVLPIMALGPMNNVSPTLRPTEMLLARPSGRPQSLILDWLDDLRATVEDLCR